MRTAPGQQTARRRPVEDLVRAHLGPVRAYLVVLGCPAHLLDDLVQDVFLSVLASSFEDRSDASTSAFLRKVARHLFLKTLDRERRRQALAEWVGVERSFSEYERDDRGEAYLAALRECLGGLRQRARAVLEQRYGERQRQAEIASKLGLSEAGVKSILVRAKKQLRTCIERRLAS